jgi:hypothetical protein
MVFDSIKVRPEPGSPSFDPTLPLGEHERERLPGGLLDCLHDGSLASPTPNARCPIYALGHVRPDGVPVLYHTAFCGPESFIGFKDKEAAEAFKGRFAAGEHYAVVEVC